MVVRIVSIVRLNSLAAHIQHYRALRSIETIFRNENFWKGKSYLKLSEKYIQDFYRPTSSSSDTVYTAA